MTALSKRSTLPATSDRRAMLAKVHIGAKQLGLVGDAYGEVLERVAGVSSAKTLSDAQLAAVLDEFRRLGWHAAAPKRPLSPKAQVRMIYGVWRDLAPYVEHHTVEALRAFVQRQTKSRLHPQGVSAPEFLDAKQATLVIEGLKAWLIGLASKGRGHDAGCDPARGAECGARGVRARRPRGRRQADP